MPSFRFRGFATASTVALSVAQGAQTAEADLVWAQALSTPGASFSIARFDTVPNGQLVAPVALWLTPLNITGFVGFDGQPISEPGGDGNVYDPTANEVFWSWDFGEPGYVPLVTPNVPLTHRDTNRAFVKRPCHVFATPGNKTVRLYAYDSQGNWGTATYTFAADGDSPAIADPDVYFSGDDTIFFSKAGIYPAEVPSGALTTDSESAVNSRITSRVTTTSGFIRVRLRRGEVYTDIANIGARRNVYFDSYGDPADPPPKQLRTANAPTDGGVFEINDTDYGYPRLVDQDWEGPYDAGTETGRRIDGPWGVTRHFVTARSLIHRCRISGVDIGWYPVALDVPYDRERVMSDCEITNWQDYGVFSGANRFAIIGSDLHQKDDALSGIHQGGGNSNPATMGNRHGPIRIGHVDDLCISCTAFFSRNGWSAINPNDWTVSPPTSVQPAFRHSYGSNAVNVERTYHAFDRCSFEGGGGCLIYGPLGDTASADFEANVLVESCLFVATATVGSSFQSPDGPLYTNRGLGQSVRNSYFYVPDVTYRAGGSYPYLIASRFVGTPDPAKPSVIAHFNNTGFIAADVLPGGDITRAFAVVEDGHDTSYLDNNIFYAPNLATPSGTAFAPLGTSALAGFTPRFRGTRWNFRPIGWANGLTSTITVSGVRELGPGDVAVGEWIAVDYPDYTGLCRGSNANGPLGQVTRAIVEANSGQYHQISVFTHGEKAMAPAAAGGTGSVVFDFTDTKIRIQNNSGAAWEGSSGLWVLLDLRDHLMDFDPVTASPLTIPAPIPQPGSAAILETATGLFAQRDFFGTVRQGKAADGQPAVTGDLVFQGAFVDVTDLVDTGLPANLSYSENVTATASFIAPTIGGLSVLQRLVTAPAHLAAYDAGQGLAGLYEIRPALLASGPQILYPGEVAISRPDPGGSISLAHAPWAAGTGTISIAYRVMLGDTELAASLPFSTAGRTPGEILTVMADVTDDTGITRVQIGSFALEENPLGPVLDGFAIDYATNTISLTSDLAATLTWRRYPPGHVFTNQAAEVLAGTGAIDGGSYAIESGANTDAVTFTGGVSGPQELWIVARAGSGPISNVVGGAVDITVTSGAPLTAPNIVGTSIGGEPSGAASVVIPLPDVPIAPGELVILPIGIDGRATDIAGLTVAGANGETALAKQALVDNNAGWDSAAIGLWYYRNTVQRTGGNVTISIVPGGVKNTDQIICTPIVRKTVKAAGDPFGQVAATFSGTEIASATTAALTAVSGASRIEACFVNDWSLPPGIAPGGWFMREVGLIGPQAIQTMSRNDQTETAGQLIGPVSVPLGANRRWSGLTWELLPLGAT